MVSFRLSLFIVFSLSTLVTGLQDACLSLGSCSECIRTPKCVWCSSKNYTNPEGQPLPRCFRPGNAITFCDDLVVLEKNLTVQLNDSFASNKDAVVQLRPQKVTIELRSGEALDIPFQYKQAEDYPLDLYLLMDLSSSMNDDLGNLKKLSAKLVSTMKQLTSNFRIGFGSFVEKNAIPFVTTVSNGNYENINYSYKNHLSLTSNALLFETQLNRAKVVSTYDAPESGFDGLMQAIVCRNEIGWRDQARRLIVFATDDSSHWAGDGKLAGIVAPNDGQCHLSKATGLYTEELTQDYPSVGHINQVVKENNINLIFAVTWDMELQYKDLNKLIEGSYTASLATDSSNVVELVQYQYGNITASVELKDNATGNVKVSYFSKCATSGEESQTSICKGLQNKTQVDFRVRVELTGCPQNPRDREQIFQISPVGISEALTVTVKMICECPCEKETHPSFKRKAVECNSVGTLKCGICHCDPTHSGRFCECDASSANDETTTCKPNNQTEKICSGRGSCICGKCECHKRDNLNEVVSGDFCQCDNFNCEYFEGKLCGGNGNCVCGKCRCHDGYTGDNCACENSPARCIPPGGGDVCSGNGDCKCGICQCNAEANGRYCQTCPTCKDKCSNFTECIRHLRSNSTESVLMNGKPCREAFQIFNVEKPEVEKEGDRECHFTDEDGCERRYVYSFDENGRAAVKIDENERSCPKPVDIGVVSGSVIGVVALLGVVLLLVWRFLIYLYDKREWARFEEEKKKAKWSSETNPLYRDVSETFANPTFNRNN